MMFGLGSFNLINEFERASNEPNAKQLASSLARLQPYGGGMARAVLISQISTFCSTMGNSL